MCSVRICVVHNNADLWLSVFTKEITKLLEAKSLTLNNTVEDSEEAMTNLQNINVKYDTSPRMQRHNRDLDYAAEGKFKRLSAKRASSKRENDLKMLNMACVYVQTTQHFIVLSYGFYRRGINKKYLTIIDFLVLL